jgi:hypothetical protein
MRWPVGATVLATSLLLVAGVGLSAHAVGPRQVAVTKTSQVEGLPAPASRVLQGRAGRQVAPITMYGTARSFRLATSGGNPLAVAQPIPGWELLPGQALQSAVLGPDGSVIMGNEPQTGIQSLATANTMAVSVFDPSTSNFYNVVMPTTNGTTSVDEPGLSVGGADISGLVPVQDGRIAFSSLWPYHGWNTDSSGEYPSFGYLVRTSAGQWSYQARTGRTAAALAAVSSFPGTCVAQPSAFWDPVADCRGLTSMAQLPISGDFVVAEYLDDPAQGRNSGGVMVLDPTGRIVGSYPYPNISVGGAPLYVLPREIDVDSTSTPGHERFVVIFDVFGAGHDGSLIQEPFTLQEFQFDAASKTLMPLSAPILTGQSSAGHEEYFETAHFDQDGNLWAAQSVVGNIQGGSIVEYSAASLAARLATGACSAGVNWAATEWGLACTPDATFPTAIGMGMVRSVTNDPTTGAMFFATISGYLLAISPTSDPSSPWLARPPVEFGLNELVDRSFAIVTPREGVIDPATQTLWLPIEQTQSAPTCHPAPVPCQPTPARLNQWLFRIDLKQIFGSSSASLTPGAQLLGQAGAANSLGAGSL